MPAALLFYPVLLLTCLVLLGIYLYARRPKCPSCGCGEVVPDHLLPWIYQCRSCAGFFEVER